MRFKNIDSLVAGDIVSSDIFDVNGHMIVASGVKLNEKTIARLIELGYPGVYINDEISKDVEIPPVISVELRTGARKCIEKGNIEDAINFAQKIIQEILEKGTVSLDLADLRGFDNYTYAHSVNVAVLCCTLGLALKLPQKELDYLVLAALLHDIGKSKIPPEILNKPSRLTKEEYLIMKKHSFYSHEMLAERYDIPIQVRNAVLLHHENEDGSGYPLSRVGDEIPLAAKIIHVVDVYDALISDRPYKRGYAPKEAAEYLMGGCGIMFDYNIVETFIRTIPLYPLGTEVVLSTGKKAIIIDNRGYHNLRPVVRTLEGFITMDLSTTEYATVMIYTGEEGERVINEESELERNKVVANTVSKNILIVDDMKANIAMLEGILEDRFSLTSVMSGQEAIEKVRENFDKYDLILMDIDMPKMTGTEAAAMINSITGQRIPILFVSAKSDVETVKMCRSLNAAGYVLRPYQQVYLLSEIERIVYQSEVF